LKITSLYLTRIFSGLFEYLMNQREGFAYNILEYQKDLNQAFLDYLFNKFPNNGAYPLILLKVKKKSYG